MYQNNLENKINKQKHIQDKNFTVISYQDCVVKMGVSDSEPRQTDGPTLTVKPRAKAVLGPATPN